MLKNKKNILFKMSGSIACYKACDLLSQLSKSGYNLRIACSPSVYNFVGKASLEGLSGHAVLDNFFEPKQMMSHIQWTQWADLSILCPATANTINKFSHGLADNILGGLFLAHDFSKPYLIAPAMNHRMLLHPTSQQSLKNLKAMGINILDTETGPLACKENGPGRLLHPDLIFRKIENLLKIKNQKKQSKILITSGGTREPIDGVRFITNFSSGKTASSIADKLIKDGHEVSFIKSKDSSLPSHEAFKIQDYDSFQSLYNLLKNEINKESYDFIIHAAAVSDFSVDSIHIDKFKLKPNSNIKIKSDVDQINIKLKRNLKIISKIKSFSKNNLCLIGFKLTNSLEDNIRKDSIDKILNNNEIDYLIHNDLNNINENEHKFDLYKQTKTTPLLFSSGASKEELSLEISKLIFSLQKQKNK